MKYTGLNVVVRYSIPIVLIICIKTSMKKIFILHCIMGIYANLVLHTFSVLDLRNQQAVTEFFKKEKTRSCFFSCC